MLFVKKPETFFLILVLSTQVGGRVLRAAPQAPQAAQAGSCHARSESPRVAEPPRPQAASSAIDLSPGPAAGRAPAARLRLTAEANTH